MPWLATSKIPFRVDTAPVKAPPLVAEQLALQQDLCQGSAVDGKESAVPAKAQPVDQPGNQFFAGAALAGDQDLAIGGSGLLRQDEDLAHSQVPAGHHHLPEGVAAPENLCAILFPGTRAFDPPSDLRQKLLREERLGEKIRGALPHGLDGGVHRGEGGEQDHREGGLLSPHLLQQVHPAAPRHPEIGQDEVGGFRQDRIVRPRAVGANGAGVPRVPQQVRQAPRHDLIVHDEDLARPTAHCRSDSLTGPTGVTGVMPLKVSRTNRKPNDNLSLGQALAGCDPPLDRPGPGREGGG